MSYSLTDEAEYAALRDEVIFHLSTRSQYLIATIAAYAIIVYWALSNPEKLYGELLAIVLYTILIVSVNMLLNRIHLAYKVSSYIAVFHELRKGKVGWELLCKEFDERYSIAILGQPGSVLFFLAILVLPISLIEKLNKMERFTKEAYPYFILSLFIAYIIFSVILYRRYSRLLTSSLDSWIKIGMEHNLIKETDLGQLNKPPTLIITPTTTTGRTDGSSKELARQSKGGIKTGRRK